MISAGNIDYNAGLLHSLPIFLVHSSYYRLLPHYGRWRLCLVTPPLTCSLEQDLHVLQIELTLKKMPRKVFNVFLSEWSVFIQKVRCTITMPIFPFPICICFPTFIIRKEMPSTFPLYGEIPKTKPLLLHHLLLDISDSPRQKNRAFATHKTYTASGDR